MLEKLYLGFILLFFVLAFAVKNIKTYLSTKQSIKGKSKKLSISILLSTCIYILIALRLIVLKPAWIFELNIPELVLIKTMAYVFISIGFIMGILSLTTMKKSWRVGIKYNQKTKLISSGIYRFSRNPYFFSYDLLILGYILVYPSIILIALYLALVFVFHKMILEEENYLEEVHSEMYLNYKKKVGRYFSLPNS